LSWGSPEPAIFSRFFPVLVKGASLLCGTP
jgi:hypothetical protein